MISRILAIIAILIVQGCASAHSKLSIDKATQRVLRSYGQETDIVKPFSELRETSTRSDGKFLFVLEGKPGIEILLDRDYWVLATSNKVKSDNVFSFIFNPKDEQSALNISIGNGIHEHPDSSLANDPGFSGISHGDGTISGQRIVWRRWADKYHIYSDCTLSVPLETESGRTMYKVSVQVTANTETRRSAIEESLVGLKLRKPIEKTNA